MTDRYRDHEAACTKIRAENDKLLADFGVWLSDSGVSPQTTRRHVSNIDLYVNHFLLYEEPTEARDGVYRVGMFLGYWMIRKVLGIGQSSIRSSGASLKKFYGFLNERGLVSDEAVRSMREQIRDGMPGWLERKRRYDDPRVTDPFEHGLV